MKVFLFAIGGTGARVLRSLTMLLASGVKVNKDVEFIPIIIDMDATNGDTLRAKNVINRYSQLRKGSYSADPDDGFFSPKMKNLASYKATSYKGEQIQDTFQLEFGNVDQTFHRFMKGDQLNYENELLLESLLDNSPEPRTQNESSSTELYLNLSKGFKGNPNIGSIVFNDLIHTKEYKYFEDICSDDDKVFIISSIFGGTGSAGFPQLVKNLRNSDKNAVKNVQIGALVVMPYFMIARKGKSAIDSNNFNSKTKAALSYYASELDGIVNDTYYIGCRETGDAYDNHEGGEDQKNLAHIIEMISSMGVLNFVNTSKKIHQDGLLNYNNFGFNYYEYGVKNESTTYDFRHFFHDSQNDVFLPLTAFTYFAKFYLNTLPTRKALKSSGVSNIDITENMLKTDPFYGELTKFFNEDYIPWLNELMTNKPSFTPFNLQEDFKRMVIGKDFKVKDTYFIDNMSRLEKKHHSIGSNQERFMRMAYDAFQLAIKDKVQALPV